jgi:hypothetical protein
MANLRCEAHEFEWVLGHAGCPRCLRAQRDELLAALKALLHHEGDFKCGISDKLYSQAENAIARAEASLT